MLLSRTLAQHKETTYLTMSRPKESWNRAQNESENQTQNENKNRPQNESKNLFRNEG